MCAHPAIEHNIRTPLMLQAVLGVDAAAIADAFAVAPATMAQRLVRAKKRIRDAGIPFAIPEREDLIERMPAVLEAVYGAYAIDWQVASDGPAIESLSAEALHLALVLTELLPDEPEVLGLAALMCFSEARRPARRTKSGFVPLDEQDTGTVGFRTDFPRQKPCCAARMPSGGPDAFNTRPRSSRRTAIGRAPGRSTGRRYASCTVRWCRSLRRWGRRWRWRRWTVKPTVRQRVCVRSRTSGTISSPASSRPGPPARICSAESAAATTRPTLTGVRSNSPPTRASANI